MKSFKELGLSQNLLKIIDEIGFLEPSEIQEKIIPIALTGKDVIGKSATGSGKTLAFGAPIIEKMHKGKGLKALVLVPTRELAEQVSKSILSFSKYNPLKIMSVYGGVPINHQIINLRTADLVVGTPGRILDHISRNTIDLSKIQFLVLDEVDRMMDMGFLYDVTKIIEQCPRVRQNFLFSATIPREILQISKKYMNNPVEVSVESYIDASKLEQIYYQVPTNQKFSLLVHLLKKENSKLVMVFCNTKRNTDFIGNSLRKNDFDALALHGDLSQGKRKKVLESFNKGTKFILVCTDVAARGLDIKNVSHVYNYDTPKTSTEYIHRIGRTARAGKEGKAITILSERDYDNFSRVLEDSSLNIKKVPVPQFERAFVHIPNNNFSSRSTGNRNFSSRRDDNEGHRRFGERNNRNYGRSNPRNFHRRERSYR